MSTLAHVQAAGLSMCAGGIIGLGEGPKDRVGLIHQLATLPVHPESVPINSLVAIAGTPLEGNSAPSGLDLARCIATARITMPKSVVRLSAGRLSLSTADQVRFWQSSDMVPGIVACVLFNEPCAWSKILAPLASAVGLISSIFPLAAKTAAA